MKQKGCASTLHLLCKQCGWKHSFCISKKQGKSFEVNWQFVYGMRTLEKGCAGARKFCKIEDMPPTLTEKAFLSHLSIIGSHMKVTGKETMKKAG